MPSLDKPSLPCLYMPDRAPSRQNLPASPELSQPCVAASLRACLALPCHTTPSHNVPIQACHASPHVAEPRPAGLSLACLAALRQTLPELTFPFHALTYRASPAALHQNKPHRAYPCLPCLAGPRDASPGLACLAWPILNAPRRNYHTCCGLLDVELGKNFLLPVGRDNREQSEPAACGCLTVRSPCADTHLHPDPGYKV